MIRLKSCIYKTIWNQSIEGPFNFMIIISKILFEIMPFSTQLHWKHFIRFGEIIWLIILRTVSIQMELNNNITLNDLEKLRILGEGTYGKCYLVQNKLVN